jgi:hypothetical protein
VLVSRWSGGPGTRPRRAGVICKNEFRIGVAGCQALIVVILIAVVTPFRICLLFLANLPMLALEVIALVIVLLLATGTAWTATVIDHHGS